MSYIQFLACLAVGMTGLCMVLTTLLDTLFSDWDVIADIRKALAEGLSPVQRRRMRIEDEMAEPEPPKLATRFVARDARELEAAAVAPEETETALAGAD